MKKKSIGGTIGKNLKKELIITFQKKSCQHEFFFHPLVPQRKQEKLVRVSLAKMSLWPIRECVRNLDLRVQVHPGELWVSQQRVHIGLEASKSADAKGDVPKIYGFVHPLHPL
jgi:hypothetical protein